MRSRQTWDATLEGDRQTAVKVFHAEESDIRHKAKRILSVTLKSCLLEGKTHPATPTQLIIEWHHSNVAPFRKARWKSHEERGRRGHTGGLLPKDSPWKEKDSHPPVYILRAGASNSISLHSSPCHIPKWQEPEAPEDSGESAENNDNIFKLFYTGKNGKRPKEQ